MTIPKVIFIFWRSFLTLRLFLKNNLKDSWGCDNFRGGGVGAHAWRWNQLSILAFFSPNVVAFFRFSIGHFPLKRSVLGPWKGIFEPEEGQMVNSKFQDPKTTWNANKRSENVTRPQLASLQAYSYKTGEKAPKGQMVPFSRGHARVQGEDFTPKSRNCQGKRLLQKSEGNIQRAAKGVGKRGVGHSHSFSVTFW